MNQPKIRVMIVDDHPMVRQGLALFVNGNKDMELVAEAENAATALRLYEEHQPDVTTMDMSLPDESGYATILALRASHPDAKIIALTSFTEDEVVEAALQSGARGFLLKNVSVEELATAIRLVHQGKSVFDARATEVLQRLIAKTAPDERRVMFSVREKEILRLLADGFTNKQIAARLKVQPSTVKQYLSHVFSKLRAQNRAEAVSMALRLKILTKTD